MLKDSRKQIQALSLISYALFIPISHSITYIASAIGFSLTIYALTREDSPTCPTYLRRLSALFVLIILWQTLTIIVNGIHNKTITIPFIRGLDLLYIFAFPFIYGGMEWRNQVVKRSLYSIVGVASCVIILGFLQKATGIIYPFPRQPFSGEALIGFFGHHLDAGGFFSSLAILLLCLIIFQKKPLKITAVLLTLAMLLTAGVLFSLARTYYVSMLLIVPIVLLRKHWIAAVAGMFSLIIFVSVLMFSVPSIKERAFSITDLKHNTSNVERVYLWKTAFDMVIDNPIAGVGFKQWRNRFAGYGEKYSGEWRFTDAAYHHAHNLYLTVAAETGVVGLILFASFWLYVMYALFRSLKGFDEDSFEKAFIAGAFFGLLNMLIGGIFEANILKPQIMLFAAYLIGASFFLRDPDRLTEK